MALLVLVAINGKTLQLDVQSSTRVDAVQHALVSFTGIPVTEQIAMYQGARLDPAKALGAYHLPVGPGRSVEDHPVFLYCKSLLKPGTPLPAPEVFPPLQVQVPPLAEVDLEHPLHSAVSPLLRALPDYERHFQHHLVTARAYWDVAQARLQRCRQLLSEQEVQARAADAARANVEAHYSYILTSYQSFLDKYNVQRGAHQALLSTFPEDLGVLQAVELHPGLQQPGGPVQRLADLAPAVRLREWYETCSRSHASFGAKVSELEGLFQMLRRDVEALFMQAPSVDLDALGRQLAECELLLDEHSSMVQVLSKDLRTVRGLVEDVVQQLGAAGGALRQGALHDAATAMEAIHETHRNRLLPRLAQIDSSLASFCAAAESSKVSMTRDVLGQLQRISSQQSRIRDMKNKLAAFHEVLARQDAAFAELKAVHRLPCAYRALLAEVVRRRGWHELYAGQAAKLAEHMERFRDKEQGRRQGFASQVSRYLPSELLARAGLASEPPHCQVSVPAPAVPLINVGLQELQRFAYLDERLAASSSLRASQQPHSASHHQQQHQQLHAPGEPARSGYPAAAIAVLDADANPTISVPSLEMENARLRAELANHITAACLRQLSETSAPPLPAGAAAGSSGGQQPAAQPAASGASSTSSQQQLSASQQQQSAAGVSASAATGAPSAAAAAVRPDIVAALQRALGMKDDLITKQQQELVAFHTRNAAYEQRITSLEALLSAAQQQQQPQQPFFGSASASSGGGARDAQHHSISSDSSPVQAPQQQEVELEGDISRAVAFGSATEISFRDEALQDEPPAGSGVPGRGGPGVDSSSSGPVPRPNSPGTTPPVASAFADSSLQQGSLESAVVGGDAPTAVAGDSSTAGVAPRGKRSGAGILIPSHPTGRVAWKDLPASSSGEGADAATHTMGMPPVGSLPFATSLPAAGLVLGASASGSSSAGLGPAGSSHMSQGSHHESAAPGALDRSSCSKSDGSPSHNASPFGSTHSSMTHGSPVAQTAAVYSSSQDTHPGQIILSTGPIGQNDDGAERPPAGSIAAAALGLAGSSTALLGEGQSVQQQECGEWQLGERGGIGQVQQVGLPIVAVSQQVQETSGSTEPSAAIQQQQSGEGTGESAEEGQARAVLAAHADIGSGEPAPEADGAASSVADDVPDIDEVIHLPGGSMQQAPELRGAVLHAMEAPGMEAQQQQSTAGSSLHSSFAAAAPSTEVAVAAALHDSVREQQGAPDQLQVPPAAGSEDLDSSALRLPSSGYASVGSVVASVADGEGATEGEPEGGAAHAARGVLPGGLHYLFRGH